MENKWKNVMFCQVWSTYFPSSPGEFRSQSKASRARPPGTKSGEFQSPDKMKLKGAAMQVPRFRFASVHPVDQFIKLESWRTWWWEVTISDKLHHLVSVTKVIKYFTVHGMDSHRKIIVLFSIIEMDRGNCFRHYTLTRLLYILGTLHCIHYINLT